MKREPIMSNQQVQTPKFVWIILFLLGCIDLIRGFMHTVLLEYSALNIAGLDLTTSTAADQLRLLGAFGISNWVTGVTFILIALKAKQIALYVMGLIPLAYGLSTIAMRFNTANYTSSSAQWGGLSMMLPYLMICTLTFLTGVIVVKKNHKKTSNPEN